MSVEIDLSDGLIPDEAYYDRPGRARTFDARLLEEPLTLLKSRTPLCFAPSSTVKEVMQAMRAEHRGCIVVTEAGTLRSRLVGIFTERDVLLKIIDSGRNPADVPVEEVMTADPESLPVEAKLAWALNVMSVGGFRHLPVADANGHPAFVVSVRDIVEFLVERFPAEILNLPPDFAQGAMRSRDGA